MRGDTTTENKLEAGGAAERRPSITVMQNMLKRVSQSTFHNRYQNLVPSVSDSSESSVNESERKQDGERLADPSAAASGATDQQQQQQQQPCTVQNGRQEALHLNPQGVYGDLARMNPFYRHFLESDSKGHVMEDAGMNTSEEIDLDAIFVPPPDFQSSPLDPQPEMETVENEAKLSEHPKDPFETLTPNLVQYPFQTSALPPNTSTKDYFNDITLNSPDLFKPIPAQTQNPSQALQLKSSDLLEYEGVDLFQSAKGEDLLHAEHAGEVNLFDKSQSVFGNSFKSPNADDELFRAPQPKTANLFYTAPLKEADLSRSVPIGENAQDPFMEEDLFGMLSFRDVFSASSTTIDPFPSPIARDLFQDVSSLEDPFGTTPSRQYDPFQDVSPGTPDIFKPHPSKTDGRDVFGMSSSNTAPKATYSTPSTNLSEIKPDTLAPLHVFQATPSESPPAVQAKSHDIFLTTPQGTKVDILEPNPFSRCRNRSMLRSSNSPAEMNHVQTFKRPPMPLPRSRTPNSKPANPIKPEATGPKVSPKPALRLAPKSDLHPKSQTPETKPMQPEDFSLYEDVLLTGQERCVEDWPDDSPQLDPDFKPSGKLRLRRESMRINSVSDGGSGDDQDVSVKKKDRKFRLSVLSRRRSKGDTKEGRSRSLPNSRKSSKEYFSEFPMPAEENDEGERDYKKPLKTRASELRRASFTSSVPTGKQMNGHLPQEAKGKVLDDGGEEEEEEEEDMDVHGSKKKKKLKIRFVPQRGFAIMVQKGAHGYTPRKNSKDKSQEECVGAHGYAPRRKSQDDDDDFGEVEERGHSLPSASKAAFMDDELFPERHRLSGGFTGDDPYDVENCKPKKPAKMKLLHVGRRSSREDMLHEADHQKQKSSCSAEEPYDEDWMEDCKPDRFAERGTCAASPGEMNDSHEDETCKPKKKSKLKDFMKPKSKKKATQPEWEDPPGAASSDFLSEAAKAEWLAAQTDECTNAGLEDEDEGGDTDSLMEWWNTVEQWDEVPSDNEDQVIREDESKSFIILAGKVHRGLRVFNKVFTERAEGLWQAVISLHAIADNINDFHQKARIAGITGGTTTAVGGATAIAGLVLAPFTMGISLVVVTAVGVGVATAGGITSASAAISDNVNNMHDRKKVEIILEAYEAHLQAIAKILHFVNQGVYKLRGHPFLRSGTQHYSEDWEVRKAVQMVNLVDSPVMRAAEVTDASNASVQGLFKSIDKYFIKDSRELKKGYKKEVVVQIKEVANVLNDGIVELNALREELQDATGNM
ncbi:uncharacterized protein si:cabz01007807.1 isoform X2 [Cyclopterus lumpus]|uniref:uncharacterized protein si:cabz01007807.1 isoform X2 n=1 Tax=Cyclopterus lumpus TaxID=8103 RepID=UPI001486E24A|nr:uncharacterized protein si:cabz01007807.1 isoform X2 [Cyclopterus lumpus]